MQAGDPRYFGDGSGLWADHHIFVLECVVKQQPLERGYFWYVMSVDKYYHDTILWPVPENIVRKFVYSMKNPDSIPLSSNSIHRIELAIKFEPELLPNCELLTRYAPYSGSEPLVPENQPDWELWSSC